MYYEVYVTCEICGTKFYTSSTEEVVEDAGWYHDSCYKALQEEFKADDQNQDEYLENIEVDDSLEDHEPRELELEDDYRYKGY